MKSSEKISIYRVLPCLAIFITAIITSGVLCYLNKLQFDEIFCVCIVILGIIPVLFFEMTYERRREKIANNIQTKFNRIALGFFLCCILMLVVSFLPEFFCPVMLFPLIMVAFSNESIGFMTGVFLNVLLTMTTGGSFHELLAYTIMVTMAVVLAKILKERDYRIYVAIILFFANIYILHHPYHLHVLLSI